MPNFEIVRSLDRNAPVEPRSAAKLILQLLIVTPLQKIHVIEPFVASVGYVENRNGNASQLQCLTIEEYRRRKLLHSMIALDDTDAAVS